MKLIDVSTPKYPNTFAMVAAIRYEMHHARAMIFDRADIDPSAWMTPTPNGGPTP